MNEANTLTLETGKYYRTRDGKKAYVYGVNPFATVGGEHEVVGVIDGYGQETWHRDGHWFSQGDKPCDLVAEWVEPKRIKGWVNVYPGVIGDMPSKVIVNNCLHETRGDADAHAMSIRIACIEIDVLEGHGLQGEAV
ncbi:hypothetical protein U8C35_06360 [Sinorhizobium medicae]|uniref:hypothetical protein n=1 Tax=Sinorhizobium medicae TaxID=110321 RepID=UPI002AF6A524|nr:hypothetical protein [Sinorhizobium medicae]WQO60055.1 hypothetical protein U8C35_06360 [Sinorhizobium medicae]